MHKKILFIILTIVVSACAPIPHIHQTFPAVEGKVLNFNSATTETNIYIEHAPYSYAQEREPCVSAEYSTSTNKEGYFRITEKKAFTWISYPGDSVAEGRVCIEYNGRKYIGYTYSRMGSPPRSVKLVCDLKHISINSQDSKGFCDPSES